MRIPGGPPQQGASIPEPSSTASQAKSERVTAIRVEAAAASTAATVSRQAAEAGIAGTGTAAARALEPSTDVSVRRDNNGRVYYLVSDADSGKEILQVPPKALRDVGQGIEDYLKEAQARATSRVNTKA